jgi:hypothetical protein
MAGPTRVEERSRKKREEEEKGGKERERKKKKRDKRKGKISPMYFPKAYLTMKEP